MRTTKASARLKPRAAEVLTSRVDTTTRSHVTIWLSAVLVALAVVVFAPVRHFEFVPWDDPQYVVDNPVVSRGVTKEGLVWALTSPGRYYWHPLTWVSHMADVEAFGMQPGAHHVTNVFVHVESAPGFPSARTSWAGSSGCSRSGRTWATPAAAPHRPGGART